MGSKWAENAQKRCFQMLRGLTAKTQLESPLTLHLNRERAERDAGDSLCVFGPQIIVVTDFRHAVRLHHIVRLRPVYRLRLKRVRGAEGRKY